MCGCVGSDIIDDVDDAIAMRCHGSPSLVSLIVLPSSSIVIYSNA